MSAPMLAVRGDLAALSAADRAVLLARSTSVDTAIADRVAAQLREVRGDGDDALRRFAREYDGVDIAELEVPRSAWRSALDRLEPSLRRALQRAADNIREVHKAFRPTTTSLTTRDGVVIGRRPDPLARVGVYAPGGRAVYPSSLLMGVVPARVAGVGEVIVCTPPSRTGQPSPLLLAAAEIAGADRLFAIGGAGAIGAMAFGTASVPAVDRIVGPGNAWVAEAKIQIAGLVPIDAPAGPGEPLGVAGEPALAKVEARELLAQAEHDPRAAVVLVTTSAELAAAVEHELARRIPGMEREAIVRDALGARGAVIGASTLDSAIAFACEYAAEHVLVACNDAPAVANRVMNAGTIFVGESSSVAFGDYLTGANHVLPTGALARRWSGLSTLDFYRWTTWQVVGRAAAASLSADVGVLADAEGLPAHATAARAWGGDR